MKLFGRLKLPAIIRRTQSPALLAPLRLLIETRAEGASPDEILRSIGKLERTTEGLDPASDAKIARKLNDLGVCHGLLGDSKKGVSVLRRFAAAPEDATPESGPGYAPKILGSVCFNRGVLEARHHRAGAAAWFNRALALNRKDDGALSCLGALHLWNGHHEKAVTTLREALKLNPDAVEAHFNLAVACERLSKQSEARDHFQTFLVLAKQRGVHLAQQQMAEKALA